MVGINKSALRTMQTTVHHCANAQAAAELAFSQLTEMLNSEGIRSQGICEIHFDVTSSDIVKELKVITRTVMYEHKFEVMDEAD